jgi:hypothetical protein
MKIDMIKQWIRDRKRMTMMTKSEKEGKKEEEVRKEEQN